MYAYIHLYTNACTYKYVRMYFWNVCLWKHVYLLIYIAPTEPKEIERGSLWLIPWKSWEHTHVHTETAIWVTVILPSSLSTPSSTGGLTAAGDAAGGDTASAAAAAEMEMLCCNCNCHKHLYSAYLKRPLRLLFQSCHCKGNVFRPDIITTHEICISR